MAYSRIGEVAEMIGISSNMLRKYERNGLLDISRNTENNYRELDIRTVGLIIRMRELKQTLYG